MVVEVGSNGGEGEGFGEDEVETVVGELMDCAFVVVACLRVPAVGFLTPALRAANAAAFSSLLVCVFLCFPRWSERWNCLWHSLHENCISFPWILLCRVSSSERVNLLPQSGFSQTKGLSLIHI